LAAGRYAAGLASLLGPAAASRLGLALRATRSAALSRSTVFFSFGHFLRPLILRGL